MSSHERGSSVRRDPAVSRSSNRSHHAQKKALTKESVNPAVLKAEYAVRGEIALLAEDLRSQLKEGADLPFSEVVSCNIGNPQQLDQKPLTYIRQIASLTEYPELLESEYAEKIYPSDVIERARGLLDAVGSIGAYSHSKGVPLIRQHVAEFITERDGGIEADPELIFLTSGASTGVSNLLQLIIADSTKGVAIPLPQYPLYSAALALNSARAVPYYLNEADDWSLDVASLGESVTKARSEGTDVKAVVVINPGNPTGNCLSEANIREILEFAYDHSLVVMADEVYQTNMCAVESTGLTRSYQPDTRPFVSFRKVLKSMDAPYADAVELVSFHSISKGQVGECGRRGGYFELVNFDPEVVDQVYKLASIQLCPPLAGQIGVDIMVRPPKEGEPSYELWAKELGAIKETLASRARKLHDGFQKLDNMTCQDTQGALYLFPKIELPPKAIEAAKKQNKEADAFYCLELLKQTGICVVPGSGFGQAPNTLHFRTTILAPGTDDYLKRLSDFHRDFIKTYS